MDEKPAAADGTATEGGAQMSFAERLSGICFEPRKTFKDVNRRSSWLGVFVILCIVSMASVYVMRMRMDRETYMRKAMETNPFSKLVPAAQLEQLLQKQLAQPPSFFERFSFLLMPFSLMIGYAVLAGIFTLLMVLIGASPGYKKILGVTIWGMAPPSIILMALATLLMYLKDPQTIEINPAANVASNLGFLVNAKLHPFLSSVLGAVDIFSAWTITLLALGFSAVSEKRLTAARAAGWIIALWLVYVLGRAAIFGGAAMLGRSSSL